MKDLSKFFPIPSLVEVRSGMMARANFRKQMVDREALKGWDREPEAKQKHARNKI